MSSLFPAPVHAYKTFQDEPQASTESKKPSSTTVALAARSEAPAYPHRVTQKFVPRAQDDFGDGGAFPEIHLAQFPLNMGKKGGASGASMGTSGNTLALQVRGDDGHVSYDAIVTQHHRDKAKVFTKFSDIVEKDEKPRELPSQDEEIETANRTRDALQLLVAGKISAAHPVNVTRQKSAKETSTYIRYTPHDQGKMGGQSQQRIIRMVDVAQDPMEPPKFQHKKAVRGPPSPPVPVLHSPPRKLTVKDQQSWKIPPVISNWKNSKGFTIALDKRLAADGRGLQQPTVNDNFASLAEALAIAERKAREEVNMRAQVQKKFAMKQKEQKEMELREMAQKARMERAGIRGGEGDGDEGEYRGGKYGGNANRGGRSPSRSRSRSRSRSNSRDRQRGRSRSRSAGSGSDADDDAAARRERDRIRHERKKDRERELRMDKLGKRGKLARDEDRDVSEKIALGQLQGTGKLAGEAMFDSRLFNQSQGIGAGFGGDDEYSVYSKPMVDRGKASVYRPKADDSAFADADRDYEDLKSGTSKRFKADKQFRGTEEVGRGRDGPVQFSYDDQKKETQPRSEDVDKRDRRGRSRSPSRSPSRSHSRGREPPSRSDARDRGSSRRRSPSRSVSRSPPPRSRAAAAPPASSRNTKSSSRRSPSRSRSRSRGARGATRRRSPSKSRSRSPARDRKRSRRDRSASDDSDSDDPYGLDQFLSDARKSSGSKKKESPPRRR